MSSELRELVAAIPDPEVPVLTLEDLGILREFEVQPGGPVRVTLTPTYSGCPAMEAIRDEVVRRLTAAGVQEVDVEMVLSPAWTTDWMTDAGREKLRAFGIAPPAGRCGGQAPSLIGLSVCCPACGSFDTRLVSRFGSTACKAHYVCESCREPFDHFKSI